MADAPWTIVVEGTGQISEYKLGNHAPGTKLAASLTVEASYVHGDSRTVVLSRPVKGKSPDYYSFDASKDLELPFINLFEGIALSVCAQ